MFDADTAAAPDASRERRVLRIVRSAVFFGVVAVLALLLWPTSLGGCTTLTVVSGHSMEPTYYTGDLVIARCGAPAVGDIVVYQPGEIHGARIIHRIIGGDADAWQLQGDNNDFVDPFRPGDDAVQGIARVRIPKIAILTGLMTSPFVWGGLLALGLAILAWPRDDDDLEAGDDTDSQLAARRADAEYALDAAPPLVTERRA